MGFAQNHHSTNGGWEPIKTTIPLPLSGSQISYQHLQFKQAPIIINSSRGVKYTRWVDAGMPKIPTEILESVFYLYRHKEDAEKGSEYGGTGFFISLPSENDSRYFYVYAVTNYHNIIDGFTTLRVKTENGASDFIELIPDIDWRYVPGGGDIIVASMNKHLNEKKHRVMCITLSYFATREVVEKNRIGVGDDVFMVGRFIDHDGGPTNTPAARFGNISVMPTRIEPMDNGVKDSYCIDLHSRSGFSGSPVFVYRTPGNDLEANILAGYTILGSGFVKLLGIHWGQFPELWELIHIPKEKLAESTLGLIVEGQYVKGLSGMTCVMPVEPILDALNIPQFREERKRGDSTLELKFIKNGYPVEPESTKPLSNQDNPQHKEDFNSLLIAAVRKKQPSDET